MSQIILTRRHKNRLSALLRVTLNLPFVLIIMLPLIYTLMMSVTPADQLYTRLLPNKVDFIS